MGSELLLSARRGVALGAAIVVLAAVTIVVVLSGRGSHRGGGAGGPALALPTSMAATGDSITRAFDLDSDHLLQDDPVESWSTGSDPLLGSQYDRIATAAPAIGSHVFNDAQSGAKMAALDHQLALAASQQVAYATVLMGANDVCAPTVATMTATAVFRTEFARALGDFFAADPGAHVFVSSLPDLLQLWTTLQVNPLAQVVWSLAHICQALLSPQATAADRAGVAAQELVDNGILQAICATYAHCRFDGFAVYRARFGAADISTADYFHPSLTGQEMLARITWAAGYWPSSP